MRNGQRAAHRIALWHAQFALLFLVLLSAACASETRLITQLVLVTDTDMTELDTVEFVIENPSGEERTAEGSIAPGAPAFLGMVKSHDAPLGPYRVQVRGLSQGQLLVTREAEVSFVPNRTRTALLHLVRSCSAALRCQGSQVCALGQCRARPLAEAELLPWPGKPPTLAPSHEPDAGAPSAEDAGATRKDGGGFSEQTDKDAAGAPTEADADATPGSLECEYGVQNCEQTCATTGNDCSPSCPQESLCTVRCENANNCNPACLGTCDVRCENANNCNVTCQAGSSCDIDCTGDSKCNRVTCQENARCILRCDDNKKCDFQTCQGSTVVDCGDGVFTCGASCP